MNYAELSLYTINIFLVQLLQHLLGLIFRATFTANGKRLEVTWPELEEVFERQEVGQFTSNFIALNFILYQVQMLR